MQGIIWNERFSVGVAEMDEQHKRLIDLINNLRASESVGINFDTVMGMFDYASTHFRDEESLLARAGYSELPAQQRQHQDFLARTVAFSKKDLNDPALATELVAFLRTWLLHHILEEDMKYGRCLPPGQTP